VLAISLGVVVFPLLSRYASRGDMPNFRDSANRALRLSLMEGMVTGVGLYILAEPITWMIFRHKAFTGSDALRSAEILKMYVLGMWAYCPFQILMRSFYAMKDLKTPLKVACGLEPLHLVMVATLIWVPWVEARVFGLATAATFALRTVVLVALLRRRLGRIGGRKLALSFLRSVIACAVMAAAVYALKWLLAGEASWLIVTVCVPAGAVVFTGAIWAMRAPELRELLGPLKQRLGKKNDADAEPMG
jgi:putative peptidoglycan lipid II flippase